MRSILKTPTKLSWRWFSYNKMFNSQAEKIKEIIDPSLCSPPEIIGKFLTRVGDGRLTRDEEPASHFCVYFLPYDSKTGKVFIVHHKKSGLWLSPGGHIDKGEIPLEALRREIKEELGFDFVSPRGFKPFLLTITPIDNAVQPCRMHYDLWYGIPADGSNFKIDLKEFHDTKWLTLEEARQFVTDPPNLQALNKIESYFD